MEQKGSKKTFEKEREDRVNWAASVTGRRLSRPIQRPNQTLVQTFISLKGLVTAQMFSKGLKVSVGCAQPGERFPNSRAFQLLRHFLNSRLDRVTYNSYSTSQLVQEFSEEIRMLVLTVCPVRYELGRVVALGQKTGHEGVMLASLCLWDVHSDTCLSYIPKSQTLLYSQPVCSVF
ncbi:hypothetical protein AOLI_G00073250 [Acnodon oligacanthus]